MEWTHWLRFSCLSKPAMSAFLWDMCLFTYTLVPFSFLPFFRMFTLDFLLTHLTMMAGLSVGFFALRRWHRDLPVVRRDASTPEEVRDLVFHILKIFLRSCVRRFPCVRMCSRTRIRGVSHNQPTDDDVINPRVLLELIDTSLEYRNLLVFLIIMLFSSMFACFNSLVIAFF